MKTHSSLTGIGLRFCGRRSASGKSKFLAAVSLAATITAASVGIPASATILTDGLIGYWSGNNTAADASSVGNNGSFGGSYVLGAPGGGSAFDLATGKVIIPDNPAYDFQSYAGWSVGFWFNSNGIAMNPSNGTFLGQDNGSGFRPKWFIDYGYTVFGPNSDFVFHLNDFNQERIFLRSQDVAFPTGWNQLTIVVDPSAVNFYLNGLSIGSDPLGSYVLRPTAPLVFGFAEPGLSYSGLMSDVTIYDRSLSPQDVAKLASVPESSVFSTFLLTIGVLFGVHRKLRSRWLGVIDAGE